MNHPITIMFALALVFGLARLAWEIWKDTR
jgi:hypothetical protein